MFTRLILPWPSSSYPCGVTQDRYGKDPAQPAVHRTVGLAVTHSCFFTHSCLHTPSQTVSLLSLPVPQWGRYNTLLTYSNLAICPPQPDYHISLPLRHWALCTYIPAVMGRHLQGSAVHPAPTHTTRGSPTCGGGIDPSTGLGVSWWLWFLSKVSAVELFYLPSKVYFLRDLAQCRVGSDYDIAEYKVGCRRSPCLLEFGMASLPHSLPLGAPASLGPSPLSHSSGYWLTPC